MKTISILIYIQLSCYVGFSQLSNPPQYNAQTSCLYILKTHVFNSFPTSLHERTSGWMMINDFSDEFNGSSLNTTKWNAWDGNCHPMSPSAYFSNSSENVKVQDGKLKLYITQTDSFECT